MAGELFYRLQIAAGEASYDLSTDVASLVVDQREGEPDQLKFEVDDPFKVLGHAVQEGMSVTLELGEGAARDTVFRGKIYDAFARLPDGGMPTVLYTAYDASMDLGLRERTRSISGKLGEVVESVAKDSGAFAQVVVDLKGNPSFGPNGLVQDDETDLQLLQRLAQLFYCVAYVEHARQGSVFHFEAEESVAGKPPVATLSYGRADVAIPLLDFQASARVAALSLPPSFSGTDVDGEPFSVTAREDPPPAPKDPSFDANLVELRRREPTRAERLRALLQKAPGARDDLRAKRGKLAPTALPGLWKKADLDELALCRPSTRREGLVAKGTAPGARTLRARDNVTVEDVGGRFSGKWYLQQVRHVLDERGYLTELSCRR